MTGATHSDRSRIAVRHLAAGLAASVVALTTLVVATDLGRGEFPRPDRATSTSSDSTRPDNSERYPSRIGRSVTSSARRTSRRSSRSRSLFPPRRRHHSRAHRRWCRSLRRLRSGRSITYFLGRSYPNNLTHVSPPFVAMVALWTALAWRSWKHEGYVLAGVATLLALWSGAILITQDWSLLEQKGPDRHSRPCSSRDGKPELCARSPNPVRQPGHQPEHHHRRGSRTRDGAQAHATPRCRRSSDRDRHLDPA